MRLNNLVPFFGYVLLIAGTYCPILKPFGFSSWDVYDANKLYGLILLFMGVAGIVAATFNSRSLLRIAGWLALFLVVLLILLAWLKIHTSFNFIPFHGLQHLAEQGIKYRWGWFVLFAGATLATVGALFSKRVSRHNAG